jgi:hypothetical protein
MYVYLFFVSYIQYIHILILASLFHVYELYVPCLYCMYFSTQKLLCRLIHTNTHTETSFIIMSNKGRLLRRGWALSAWNIQIHTIHTLTDIIKQNYRQIKQTYIEIKY